MPEPTPPSSGADPTAEKELVAQLHRFCRRLNRGATALQVLTALTALAGIVLSLLVATYTGSTALDAGTLKVLAFLAAVCTALYSGFRLRSKAADLRSAYRLLNTDLMRYRMGYLNPSQLIDSYSKAEERIGQLEVDGLVERSGQTQPPAD
jgi:hypothetical protein